MVQKAKYKSAAGKGSLQRPRFISDEQWAINWERAFGKNKKEELDKAIDKVIEEYRDTLEKLGD